MRKFRGRKGIVYMTINILQAFEKEPLKLDFIWSGFLAGTVGALVAPGATGKSFWALEAAMSVACSVTGGDIARIKPQKSGRVLYLEGEDPESALTRRLYTLGQYLNADARASIAKNLDLITIMGSRFDIMSPKQLEQVIKMGTGTRLIILDTLSRIHHLDENSNGDMARLISTFEHIAAETGTSVLYLHHVSKSSAWAGATDQQQAARGASVLVDNVRWCGYMARMTKDEAEKLSDCDDRQAIGQKYDNFVRFGISKQNHDMRIPDRWYKRDEGGVLLPIDLMKTQLKIRDDKKKENRNEI